MLLVLQHIHISLLGVRRHSREYQIPVMVVVCGGGWWKIHWAYILLRRMTDEEILTSRTLRARHTHHCLAGGHAASAIDTVPNNNYNQPNLSPLSKSSKIENRAKCNHQTHNDNDQATIYGKDHKDISLCNGVVWTTSTYLQVG